MPVGERPRRLPTTPHQRPTAGGRSAALNRGLRTATLTPVEPSPSAGLRLRLPTPRTPDSWRFAPRGAFACHPDAHYDRFGQLPKRRASLIRGRATAGLEDLFPQSPVSDVPLTGDYIKKLYCKTFWLVD